MSLDWHGLAFVGLLVVGAAILAFAIWRGSRGS